MDVIAVVGTGAADGSVVLADRVRVPLLTEVLFDGRFDDLHSPWTELFRREIFRYRDGLSPSERSELAYERLRVVNEEIESVEDLVAATDRLVSLHEWLGVVDGTLTTLATIHYNLFLGSLLQLDPRRTVDLLPFVRLRRYGTVLITELGYGNNAAELETTATYRPENDTFVLHTPSPGAQKFMPNTGPVGGRKSGLVAARLIVREQNCGVFLFLVPLRDDQGPLPGIRVRPLSETPGSAVDHAITSFDRVTLPRAALLAGDHAELTAEGAFRSPIGSRRRRFLRSIQRVTAGKLCLSAAALGGARASLTIAVRYGHRRHTFAPASRSGVPLFAYRCHQTRLLGAAARAYAATFLLRETTHRCAGRNETGSAEAEVLVAATKGWITWQARDIVIECRERCGAQGLLSANRVVDLLTPIESTITAEGDNLVIWTKAAADMLTGRGYSPPAAPTARSGPLTDCALLLDLLACHELYCLQHARRQLGRSSSGPMDRWNHAVNPALDLVDAYATRRAAQAFLASAVRVGDDATRSLLERVFQLFVLQRLAPHAGLLLADGHLTAEAVRDLAPAVDRVSAGLAPHALTLVEAFAVPDAILQAPIATDGYDAAYDDPAGPWQPAPVG
ncbi:MULTISPECIES: acyl-CoA dehydrogenase [unclassified Streptomyces]|uniref:acyl-CoA dehydrogenase family protein n=1 Tax=unclassified Streptomyces TaxID=2593676 RepID=UPI002DDB656A|nr:MULTISPECIES: acyl-CoA dehydrogenase [unclassified Streptomyces]WSA91822.1 acyl-CoA dehydrogenase family protein [Streptomyces sp. NBC_01795]WSS15534.1 acyl-CoA dehydrogenase family protein [Streptomyces sp. NBC_01186]WSS44375.1 acyl-CoA dehydrogenase family protein [Streptomyces sp. NBC_01187]